MKTLFLHIGNPRTGTTAIQRYVHENENALLCEGLRYVECCRDVNGIKHNSLVQAILREMGEKYKKKEDEKIRQFGEYIECMIQEVKLSDAQKFLVSSEGFATLSMYEASRSWLKRLLNRLSDLCKIKVVLYVRDPWELLLSNYSQRCKKGCVPLFLDFAMNTRNGILDQSLAYKVFADVFGVDNIVLERYRSMAGRDFISGFLNLLEVDHEVSEVSDRVNASPPASRVETSRIRAVTRHKMRRYRENSVLHGSGQIGEENLVKFVRRMNKLNQINAAFFDELFGVEVGRIELSRIIDAEREINSMYLRKSYVESL